jgi:hypothetical protein
MLDSYFTGSVPQLIERSRELTATIPRNLPRAYDALAQLARARLNSLIAQFGSLIEDQRLLDKSLRPERLRKFKRLVSELDTLEASVILALRKAQDEDHRLNDLLERITKEIDYPAVTPTVTTLSRDYFYIFPEFKLLFVPLVEGHFLLHLPDLYHELAHPILIEENDPIIEPLQRSFSKCLDECIAYVQGETQNLLRRKSPVRPEYMLGAWERSWTQSWLSEFYCDVFALITAGPAFAWSHLHLAIKRGDNPFIVPALSTSSHPAADARMRVLIFAMKLLGLQQESVDVHNGWRCFTRSLGVRPEPEYFWCYPDFLLDKISTNAVRGTTDIGVHVFSSSEKGTVTSVLNEAWAQFWAWPGSYVQWEKKAVEELLGARL